MKNTDGNFTVRSNGSSIKSLVNKPHQPGQVGLGRVTLCLQAFFPATLVTDNKGQMGMSPRQTPPLREGVEPTSCVVKAEAPSIPSRLS